MVIIIGNIKNHEIADTNVFAKQLIFNRTARYSSFHLQRTHENFPLIRYCQFDIHMHSVVLALPGDM